MSAKKLKIEYGDSIFALGRENLRLVLPSAGGFELKVLLLAASDDALRADYDTACEKLCKELDCTKTALARALDFWEKAGVMSAAEVSENAANAEQANKKALARAAIPSYTEAQTADVIEAHSEIAGIIDACQQISGKVVTPAEAQTIVGIYDYLGLNDTGYIETLYSYCKRMGKTSARYIEKVAISLADEGINTTDELDKYIKRREMLGDTIEKLRELLGAKSRTLTTNERKYFDRWADEWNLPYDVIKQAYEITVDKFREVKLPYMNKILENWHKEGLTTKEAVEESLEAYRQKKAGAAMGGEGFKTDEYFEAALERSRRYLEGKKTGK